MNPNDKIRHLVLKWFYERNSSATSQYGKKGSAVKISDVKAGLKEADGLSQQEVMSNLTYLIDKGWINKNDIAKTITVKGGTVPSVVTWYEISSAGIDKIEGESEFQQSGKFAGINISAIGNSVITLGDGNVVNAKFTELRQQLDAIKDAIIKTDKIEPSTKLDVVVDIESLKDQLAKPSPNKSIIGALWKQIENVATIAGVVDLVQKSAPLVAGILGG